MLFLPAAALCCLCSALVTMAAQLFQDDPELTKRVGESVSIDCDGTNQCTSLSRVNWYQKKETGTFKDFQTASTLNIKNVGLDHSAIYYCYCWVSHAHSEK
ncbi:unnamed protein product [Oreochromis niloticus]|nr:unnamed protein product [Mustela putorius furo]